MEVTRMVSRLAWRNKLHGSNLSECKSNANRTNAKSGFMRIYRDSSPARNHCDFNVKSVQNRLSNVEGFADQRTSACTMFFVFQLTLIYVIDNWMRIRPDINAECVITFELRIYPEIHR